MMTKNDAGAPDEFIRGETDVDSEGITYERMNYEYLSNLLHYYSQNLTIAIVMYSIK